MIKKYVILLGLCIFILNFPSILPVTSSDPGTLPIRESEDTATGYSMVYWLRNFHLLWISNPKTTSVSLDNILPTASITSPSNNDTVSGIILITGTANDSDGFVDHVEVSIDRGPWFTAVGTTTWTYEWDTTKENNVLHKISARSNDGTDYSNVTSIDVTVYNTLQNTPPMINITYPFEGETVANVTTVMGSAYDTDDDPLNISLRIDYGNWEPVGAIIAPPYISWSYQWNTSQVSNGDHIITVQAHDGQNYTQASITVTVTNLHSQPNSSPVINITDPLNGTFVTGTTTIMGTASDIDGVIQQVEIRINDGSWNPAMGTDTWSYHWNTRILPDNIHTISARSFDGSNYSDIQTIILTVDNTPPTTNLTITGAEGANNWWTSTLTITLTGTDNTSGIKNTYYKLDTSDWETYTTPITLPDEGAHILMYYSRDIVDNRETNHSHTLKIDKTSPITKHTLTPDSPTGTNDWYTRRVTITFIGNDSVSWANTTWYRVNNGTWENYIHPVILHDDGRYRVEYYSIDNAGNQEDTQLADIKIDKNPPTIQITKPDKNKLYIFNREIIRLPFQIRILGKITLEVFVNDQTSGIYKVQYILDYGTRIDVTQAPYQYIYDEPALVRHRHVITAKAVDRAGNTNNTDELSIWIYNI